MEWSGGSDAEKEIKHWLIVGLGNPGVAYSQTRHNVGALVVEAFAKKQGWSFHPEKRLEALIAKGTIEKQFSKPGMHSTRTHGTGTYGNGLQKVFLVLPQTYMNDSGVAVRKCMDYYKLPRVAVQEALLVISDDIYLPFGKMRLRDSGSAGGHNGLASVEAHLGTRQYPRLRIGVGDRVEGELSEHVLGEFLPEEKDKLPQTIEEACALIEKWLRK